MISTPRGAVLDAFCQELAKMVLISASSAVDIWSDPFGIFAKFQTFFYVSPEDAVFKALGVD